MIDVGALQNPPFFLCKTQIAAVITRRAHLGKNSREHLVVSEAHGGFEFTYIVLVFEHGVPDAMFFCLAFRLSEQRAHSWDRWELQRVSSCDYVRYGRIIRFWKGIIFTAQIMISLPSIHCSNGKRML